jgi:hypothetical protein
MPVSTCRSTPWEPEAAVKLIRLATSVMRYHDTLPGGPAEVKRRENMKRLIDLLRPALDASDAIEVKRLLPGVMEDTRNTSGAATRVRAILAKLGKTT